MITRREAIVLGAGALLSASCGASEQGATRTGSTLASTWVDSAGAGTLRPGPGERGDVLLMRPLLAHNSGRSHPETTRHRRILHLEFAGLAELPDGFAWHTFVPSATDG